MELAELRPTSKYLQHKAALSHRKSVEQQNMLPKPRRPRAASGDERRPLYNRSHTNSSGKIEKVHFFTDGKARKELTLQDIESMDI